MKFNVKENRRQVVNRWTWSLLGEFLIVIYIHRAVLYLVLWSLLVALSEYASSKIVTYMCIVFVILNKKWGRNLSHTYLLSHPKGSGCGFPLSSKKFKKIKIVKELWFLYFTVIWTVFPVCLIVQPLPEYVENLFFHFIGKVELY